LVTWQLIISVEFYFSLVLSCGSYTKSQDTPSLCVQEFSCTLDALLLISPVIYSDTIKKCLGILLVISGEIFFESFTLKNSFEVIYCYCHLIYSLYLCRTASQLRVNFTPLKVICSSKISLSLSTKKNIRHCVKYINRLI